MLDGITTAKKKAFIILGNGFTIDFLSKYAQLDHSILNKIDVQNLFRLGDKIETPWNDRRPGLLSFRHCPSLWTLGVRTSNTVEESAALIGEIITCVNMFFDFVNDPQHKANRLELIDSNKDIIYLKAYSELIVYLHHLFAYYNRQIDDDGLKNFINSNPDWGWIKFFETLKRNVDNKYEKITFVTYNYDIWLERILRALGIPFCVSGLESNNTNIEIIKPHGSISFIRQGARTTTYSINYNFDFEGVTIDQLELHYDDLMNVEKSMIIPPAGDSSRFEPTALWSQHLRENAKNLALNIGENDEVVLCGISYGHVDRREIDALLISLDQKVNFTFVNPNPPRDLNAVLISIFQNYVQQSSSSQIGEILNGKII